MIKHTRCGNKAEKEGITFDYDYYCPFCDEDLCLSECSFETVEGYKTYKEMEDFITLETEITVEKVGNTFRGNWRDTYSSVDFEYVADCYVYCFDFVKNGYKTL